ncbi:leucyl/phenylalanyl-tRNA--protein transferase [Flavihumibacter petaseus]|uniref:Leucyl/phenylalanyl-tRNA--protein transferase n=1 Tax=Flavihumibacter petaseus NBRC 106054 TaxID=1220578 RepID=A0A0E9N2Z6_9BACT|nr:leucyl/phenylalanyl-tRNA--protein transferase [Flavihumibacter petaseus]GAO43725.1 leucyl/phenylalanyl-tRNA--protein transferase [Flavihumibacter petaseus NBRC 106054]
MPLYLLDHTLTFPPVELAEPDGMLAVGGDLSTERLLKAYRLGIFPWYDEPPICWWCPDPRFVLFPAELKVSKSMRTVLQNGRFEFRVNYAFREVMTACQQARRRGQDGTWINEEIIDAYTALHEQGYAWSAEAWQQGQLVGGLYGIRLGKVFFGESMFSAVSNASKFAFIQWVRQLESEGVVLIDCQVHTEHLESLGARFISRESFTTMLDQYC